MVLLPPRSTPDIQTEVASINLGPSDDADDRDDDADDAERSGLTLSDLVARVVVEAVVSVVAVAHNKAFSRDWGPLSSSPSPLPCAQTTMGPRVCFWQRHPVCVCVCACVEEEDSCDKKTSPYPRCGRGAHKTRLIYV